MGLFISTDITEQSFHLGMKFPRERVKYVEQVQADGYELQWIMSNLSGLPFPIEPVRIVTWYGDHAKFIVGNFKG